MSAIRLSVGDWGTRVYVRLVDQYTGYTIDPAGATVTADIDAPGETDPPPITMLPSVDPDHDASEWVQWIVPQNFFTEAGTWYIRPKYETGSGLWRALKPLEFKIIE